jgi:nitroreductase
MPPASGAFEFLVRSPEMCEEEKEAKDVEFESVILGRRSIRKFKPDAVSRELLEEILDQARWSPSWANTQAWSIHVVGGETLERIKSASPPSVRSESSHPDFRMPAQWPPHLAARTKQLYDVFSAPTADGSAPAMPNFAEFFGAPCVLFFAAEEGIASDYLLFDSGLIVQSVCLAAHDKGLGTCIMAMAVRDPDTLRDLLPGAKDKRFVIGVALGYPDEEAPINQFERSRAPLEKLVSWVW